MKQVLIFIGLVLFVSGCAMKEETGIVHKVSTSCDYYSLKSAECLNEKRFIDHAQMYDVLFVGDYHDSANAHKVLVTLINRLSERGYKIALANEWFSPQENMLLQQYVNGELDANASKALDWKKRVGYDFNLTAPIYKAVIDNNGTLYGVNLDKQFKKMISDQNISAMDHDEKLFYTALDLNVSAHRQMMAPFFSHCHHSKNGESQRQCQQRMYRVQVAWDTMMGQESAKLAADLKRDEKLIVFVGAMHLESGLGANLRFSRLSDIPFMTIVPRPKTPDQPEVDVELGSSDILYLYKN